MPTQKKIPADRNPDGTRRLPAWGRGSDPDPYKSGADREDANTRERWHRKELRSTYLLQIAIPPTVPPGDRTTAGHIALRVHKALQEHSKWTHAERARLRRLYIRWSRRAEGLDSLFNIRGHSTVPNPDKWYQRDIQFTQFIEGIRKVYDDK